MPFSDPFLSETSRRWDAFRGVACGALMLMAGLGLVALNLFIDPRQPNLIGLICGLFICGVGATEFLPAAKNFRSSTKKLKSLPKKSRFVTAEDRLDELERLKRRDMVTAEEYAAKRRQIINEL